MNSKRIDRLINEVSLLTGYTKKEVREMWMSQWAFLSTVVSGANTHDVEFDNVHIVGLAKFYATRRKKRYFETMKKRREEALLPNVYAGQMFDMFTYRSWKYIGEAYVRDAAPLYMGKHVVKERYPRVMEFLNTGKTQSGIHFHRLPINKEERNGYI